MFRSSADGRPSKLTSTFAAVALAVGLLAATAPAAQAADDGHITGTVTNEAGEPIANVPLDVITNDGDATNPFEGDSYLGETDENGDFDVPVPAGTYRIAVNMPGSTGNVDGVVGDYSGEFYNGKPTFDSADDVIVSSGDETALGDTKLAAAGRITGTVKNSADDGIQDVAVFAYTPYEDDGNTYWNRGVFTFTDASGNYDLGGLATGTYRIGFDDDEDHLPEYYDNAPTVDSAENIAVTASETVSGKNAQLADPGHITGRVTRDSDGAPLRGLSISALRQVVDGGETYWEEVGADFQTTTTGAYDIGGLPPGDYRVLFQKSGYVREYYDDTTNEVEAQAVTVAAGQAVSGVDAGLAEEATISGAVTYPAGLEGELGFQEVSVVDPGTGRPLDGVFVEPNPDDSTADTYHVDGLTAGSYRVAFARASGFSKVAAQFFDNVAEASGVAAATAIDLATGEDRTGVDATLVEGGTIDGKVVDSEGAPVANCEIRAFTQDDSLVTRAATSGADGTFSVTGLSTGDYDLAVGANTSIADDGVFGTCGDGVERFFKNADGSMTSTKADAVPVTATLGETVTLPHELVYVDAADVPDQGSLHGSVEADGGAAVDGAYVGACHVVDDEIDRCYGTETDETGAYELGGLAPGDYSIDVSPPDDTLRGGSATATVVVDDDTEVDTVTLEALTPIPADTTFDGQDSGVPSVYWDEPSILEIPACASGASAATWKVTFADGSETNGSFDLTVTGDKLTATIPAFSPRSGEATVSWTLSCGGVPLPARTFDIYIDPSGTVVDQDGDPISGATVTLTRSDTETGTYTTVPNGSAIMSPGNRVNPDTTDADGKFGWDVTAGFYKVEASAPMCGTASTTAMQVPPPRTNLVIELTCARVANTAVPTITGTPKVGQTLTVSDGAWTPAGVVFAHQWLVDGADIPSATGATYVPVAGDVGKKVSVRVTGSKAGFVSVSVTSAETASVVGAGEQGPRVVRLAGDDRYETAVEVSEVTFAPGVDAVFVATGAKFADGLTGGPGAAKLGGPVLLTRPDVLPASVGAEIKRLEPKKIYLLGGSAAISAGVEAGLEGLGDADVVRLAGEDRYGTAAEASSLWSSAGTVYLATGADFADALSGGAAAARDGAPVLLTAPDELPAATVEALKRLAPSQVVIVGGTNAISSTVATAVAAALPDATVSRTAGADRYETSAMLLPSGAIGKLVVATGSRFADALAGVAASAHAGAAFALTREACLPATVRAAAPADDVSAYFLLGGPLVVSSKVTSVTCAS